MDLSQSPVSCMPGILVWLTYMGTYRCEIRLPCHCSRGCQPGF